MRTQSLAEKILAGIKAASKAMQHTPYSIALMLRDTYAYQADTIPDRGKYEEWNTFTYSDGSQLVMSHRHEHVYAQYQKFFINPVTNSVSTFEDCGWDSNFDDLIEVEIDDYGNWIRVKNEKNNKIPHI